MSSFLLNYKKGLTGIPQTQFAETFDYFAPNVTIVPPAPVSPFTQGMVMMWDKLGSFPTGWYLCDGGTYNGYVTPTLINRFVVLAGGTGSAYPTVGLGGGAGSTLLTLNMLPDHTHGSVTQDTISGTATSGQSFCALGGTTGGINSAGYVAGTPVPTLPPYYSLAYICYCGVPA